MGGHASPQENMDCFAPLVMTLKLNFLSLSSREREMLVLLGFFTKKVGRKKRSVSDYYTRNGLWFYPSLQLKKLLRNIPDSEKNLLSLHVANLTVGRENPKPVAPRDDINP